MTVADLKLVDESIIKHGDGFWNDERPPGEYPGKDWVIQELLEILAKDDLDLKVIRKK